MSAVPYSPPSFKLPIEVVEEEGIHIVHYAVNGKHIAVARWHHATFYYRGYKFYWNHTNEESDYVLKPGVTCALTGKRVIEYSGTNLVDCRVLLHGILQTRWNDYLRSVKRFSTEFAYLQTITCFTSIGSILS